jgi:hypothetical protein
VMSYTIWPGFGPVPDPSRAVRIKSFPEPHLLAWTFGRHLDFHA